MLYHKNLTKKCLKIPKLKQETVIRRWTDNKKTNGGLGKANPTTKLMVIDNWIWNTSYTTDVTSVAETAYPSGAYQFTIWFFLWDYCCSWRPITFLHVLIPRHAA